MIRERLTTGERIAGLALAEALWARMCEGTREDGSVIEPNDPGWADLSAAAAAAADDPSAWLTQRGVYGDWAQDARFASAFGEWLDRIRRNGVRATLRNYLEGGG